MKSISERKFEEYQQKIGNKISDFKIISELGRGSYGVVYKVQSRLDNQTYVIKKLNLKHMKEKHQREAWKEASLLRKLNHPNVIKFYNSFLEDDCLYILMEFAENGDLYHVR